MAVAFAFYRRETRARGRRLAVEVGRYTAVMAAAALVLALAGALDGYAGRALAAYLQGLADLRGWLSLVYSS